MTHGTLKRMLAASTICVVSGSPSAADTVTQTYRYDALGRLTKSCAARVCPADAERTFYTYDAASNRQNYKNAKVDFELLVNGAIYSSNTNYQLVMQTDGNLVLYKRNGSGWTALWSTGTFQSGSHAAFQVDGNFVVCNASNFAIWNTQTFEPCANLAVLDDGNVVIYNQNGVAMWSTNTVGQ